MIEHIRNIADAGAATAEQAADAAALTRGVSRLLRDLDYRVLSEVPLATGRRVDVLGLHRKGSFVIVEVKSSLSDFRTDTKWQGYLGYCDLFYFAVAPGFPLSALPVDRGVIIADAYQGVIVRQAVSTPLNSARRKALTLRFARTAASRLHHLMDPHPPSGREW